MFITSLGTAVPATQYSQKQCWEALRAAPQYARLAAPARALLERVLTAEQGVRTRHLALADLAEAFQLDPDVLHARFRTHAPELAASACRTALIASRRCTNVVSACVEVCSAALYIDDDPGVLVSAWLFGDGAAAAALCDKPFNRSVEWLGSVSLSNPDEREALRMEQRGGLLRVSD